jgi:ElaA protein
MQKGLTWNAKPWSKMNRDELHAILRLRIDVFVLEQNCPYSELDGKDLRGIHVWASDVDESKGVAAACCTRVLAPGVSYKEPSIGRVATRSDLRGTGLGKVLMHRSLEVCQREWPGHDVRISAQCYLGQFYRDLGFVPCGETYLEDDIPHVAMLKPMKG